MKLPADIGPGMGRPIITVEFELSVNDEPVNSVRMTLPKALYQYRVPATDRTMSLPIDATETDVAAWLEALVCGWGEGFAASATMEVGTDRLAKECGFKFTKVRLVSVENPD